VSDAVEVSLANESQLRELAALRFRWRTEESGEVGLDRDEFTAQLGEWWAEHLRTHLPYLALVGGEAVGCAWLLLVDRVPGPQRFVRRAGLLQSVYVIPERRDRKIGTTLVDRLITDARAMGLDYLTVHPSARSYEFYRRMGFADADAALELRFTR
jgi:GNAT superfamily N-acetyltransferase